MSGAAALPERDRRSLADRLTRTLIVWMAVVWLCALLAVVWYVDVEINRNFDSEMTESAHRMIDIASRDYEHATEGGERPALPMVGREPLIEDDSVVFQLVDREGRVLVRSSDAPVERFAVPLAAGFRDAEPWRIYTVAHPRKPLFLLLADPLDERLRHRWRTLVGLAVPLAAMLPLFAWGLRGIARRELRVVQRLEGQIAERGSADLTPLALGGLPAELHSVGDHVNRLLERLGDALDAERALAANAAHELRTPLAAARLRLQSALDGDLARGDVQAALDALSRLVHRTEKLLQLSRAESAASHAQDEVDLVRLTAVVVDEMWDTGRDADRIDLLLDADGVVPASGDPDALAIALRNLVENALRYAAPGRVEVAVEPPCTLVVRDHGPGVDPSRLQTLLARHARGTADRTGYGLGLSIVQSIARRQRASFEIVSPRPDGAAGLEARIALRPWRAGESAGPDDASGRAAPPRLTG